MARGSASPILVLVPLLLGLLAISSIPNVIAETTTTIENPIDQNFPDMATTDLPTTMNQNLALKYRTVLTKYVSGSCSTMINKQNIVNTTQNITALGEGILEINEITTNNDSLSPISNKEFNYKISNNSYMPINTSSEMPTALIGEWEHYYPGSMNSSRLINHQEVAYLLYKYSPKIVTITQTGTQSFILGNLSTTAMVYEGIYTINDYYEG